LSPKIRRGKFINRLLAQRGGTLMMLWWLKFRDGSAVILEGESVSHARLLAAK
jgi:hypothetical protein